MVIPDVAALALIGLSAGASGWEPPGGRGEGGGGGGSATTAAARRARGRHDRLAYLILFGTGFVSLTGVVVLALSELRGRAWRAINATPTAGALRHDFRPGWVGVFVYYTERVTVVAAIGYRPRLVGGLAAALSAVFAVVAAVSASRIVGLRWRRRGGGEGGGRPPP